MTETDDRIRARRKVLALLTDHDRTEKELRDKLTSAGFESGIIEDAIGYAKSYGYVDDSLFAARYIDRFRDCRSLERIRCDLLKKGLTRDQISQALEEAGPIDQKALIRRLVLKKAGTERPADSLVRQKLIQSLLRRGLRLGDVLAVLGGADDMTAE